ncbi:probable methyltransferase-like protein 15 homolog isoform X2 [Cimex lectularius]|nr:probable methyltransferase-like protein 15 homolog isoform X2 [Cimex lectularius]
MDSDVRGFSISRDAKLDMRMDGERFPDNPTAAEVIKYADEEDLVKIFKIYGEEKLAKKIARGIIEARYMFTPVSTTFELASLVANICDNKYKKDKLQRPTHVSTKIFQALRIFVNNELNEINYGLAVAHKFLKIGGRLVTISFHSLEDKIVKQHMIGPETSNNLLRHKSHISVSSEEEMSKITNNKWVMLNKHVVTPTETEVQTNPRSRSAKLRAAVKIN